MEDRRVQRTRQYLRAALVRLMKKKPISEITVTELTREADLDRRTFYLHYDNLFEIVDEIEQEARDLVSVAFQNGLKENRDIFEILTQIMMSNIDYYDTIILDRSYYRLEHDCKNILKEGITECFRKSSPLDDAAFDYYREYCASGIINMYTHWIRNGKDIPVEELTRLVQDAVRNGWEKLSGE